MEYTELAVKKIVADLRKFVTAGQNLEHKGLESASVITQLFIAQKYTFAPLQGARIAITELINRLGEDEPSNSDEPRLSQALKILFGMTGIKGVVERKEACNRYYFPSLYTGESRYTYENFDRKWYPKLLESLAFKIIERENEYRKQVLALVLASVSFRGDPRRSHAVLTAS